MSSRLRPLRPEILKETIARCRPAVGVNVQCVPSSGSFKAFLLFGTRDLFNISYSRELYLFSKFLHFEEIVRVKMAVCFEMIVSET